MTISVLPTTAVDLPRGHDPGPACAPIERRKGRLGRVVEAIGQGSEWVFGAFAIILGLSVLSAAPVLQFLSFGYLLESGGRVARSGRLRDGLIGVRRAARLGSMVIGAWLMLLPLRMASTLANSAELIEPGGSIARRWRVGLLALTVLMVLHVAAACARGGKLRHFFWPFVNPLRLYRRLRRGGLTGAYVSTRDAVCDFVIALRLPYYFRLGLLGFVGTLAWLALPVTLIAAGRRAGPLGLIGGLMLGVVSLALPFLQVRFAVEGRFRSLFAYRAIRDRFRRAPWAFALASFLTLTFAVPLYLLKIEMIPRETAWLPSVVFILFIFPARLLTGWAYARSIRRDHPRHGVFRWTGRLGMLPVGLIYALIVFFTQYTAWHGIWSLYEQHAFLLPVPFLSM